MQRAHEALLLEAEHNGLPLLGATYDGRGNELGVTFELLVYGDVGRPPACSNDSSPSEPDVEIEE